MHKIYLPKLSKTSFWFPDPREASNEGLLAWGGDLNPKRLLQAYKEGIFPWYNEDSPILWWSPNPRLILNPSTIKISKSLKKSMKKFHITFDNDFDEIIKRCQITREENCEQTWLIDEMIEAYKELHRMGFAHSVEVYEKDELVGGLYGVSLGKVFCGESMFSQRSDASKSALVYLCQTLNKYDFNMIDCQVPTEHLKSMGAYEVSRDEFLDRLEVFTCKDSGIEDWSNL